ncbi:SAM-dependent methyltransferase [Seonamhaeicola aphaedonensis]|uniref:16S rRNA (Cytidine1402-2'-O)-methyltransferase n=1 Tax=Seonamhaeicola aphaedonensis TaxID=1461338 RepID=A0A3D9H8U1_9FLAO|nr:SAM-dependent methyltransferase [Seonamhaeicola aphaedonensis]RED45905.1 16S rRNA (cytidine1402-2'-O)-methyltransferase [Seonamhaeicola aphaedonensis]
MNRKGHLYLIPCTLGENEPLEVLPITIKETIERINIFIVENEKSARRFIKKITPEKSQPSLQFFILNKHTDITDLPNFLSSCSKGENVGLLSEAGCPGIADPGADIVKIAHKKNIKVIPLVGPSSILLALMSSGMNGQRFAFNGYLPIDKNERKNELRRLERLSLEQNQSQVFIETPYRNNKMLEDITSALGELTNVCVACDITLSTEFIKTQTVNQWKKNMVDLHKRPTIFIIHKS